MADARKVKLRRNTMHPRSVPSSSGAVPCALLPTCSKKVGKDSLFTSSSRKYDTHSTEHRLQFVNPKSQKLMEKTIDETVFGKVQSIDKGNTKIYFSPTRIKVVHDLKDDSKACQQVDDGWRERLLRNYRPTVGQPLIEEDNGGYHVGLLRVGGSDERRRIQRINLGDSDDDSDVDCDNTAVLDIEKQAEAFDIEKPSPLSPLRDLSMVSFENVQPETAKPGKTGDSGTVMEESRDPLPNSEAITIGQGNRKVLTEASRKSPLRSPSTRTIARFVDKFGRSYCGHIVAGSFDGLGVLEWPSGSTVYKGNFKNGMFHGLGVMTGEHGTYEGSWVNGTQHGFGVSSAVNGEVYSGTFNMGLRHGEGMIEHRTTGKIERGYWKHGELSRPSTTGMTSRIDEYDVYKVASQARDEADKAVLLFESMDEHLLAVNEKDLEKYYEDLEAQKSQSGVDVETLIRKSAVEYSSRQTPKDIAAMVTKGIR